MGSGSSRQHDKYLETLGKLREAYASLKQLEMYRTAFEISKGWREPNQFTYGHPTDDEFETVFALVGEVFPTFNYDKGSFKQEMINKASYVVKLNNQIVGFVLVGLLDHTNLSYQYPCLRIFAEYHHLNLARLKIISSCGVLPEFRLQGVGQHLFELVLQDNPQLILEVNTNNLSAIKLYERNGFHKVGYLPNYYWAVGGGDGYLMAYGLEQPPQLHFPQLSPLS